MSNLHYYEIMGNIEKKYLMVDDCMLDKSIRQGYDDKRH